MTPTMFDIPRPLSLAPIDCLPCLLPPYLAPNTNSVLKKLPEGRTDRRTDRRTTLDSDASGISHTMISHNVSLSPRFCRSPQITSISLSHTHTTNHGAEHSEREDRHSGGWQTDKNVTRQRKRETDLSGDGNDRGYSG